MIEVRFATREDLTLIEKIEKQNSATPWSLQQFETEIENEFAFLLCAEIDGELAGLCDVHIVLGDAHLNEVAVAEQHRRKGVGAAMVERACALARENQCKTVTLEVRSSSREGKRFYESLGFRRISEKWGFYRDPNDDALVYQKEI